MLIQDEELRSIYQDTGTERLHKLQTGLLQLEQSPDNQATLGELRRELHSLKGDSRSVGVETVASLAQELEEVVKSLQQRQVELTLEISDGFYQGIYALGQLMHEAVTGEPSDVDFVQTIELLTAAVTSVEVPPTEFFEDVETSTKTIYILDDELREIYQLTSEGRLRALANSLRQLEQNPVDTTTIETLRRETHSLKGDSRAVELDVVADLVQPMEDIINGIQQQSLSFTAQVGSCLRDGLEVLSQLIHEATSGESSGVAVNPVYERLTALSATVPAFIRTSEFVEAVSDMVPNELTVIPDRVTEIPATLAASVIEDVELREIYQATTKERLQTLEASLLYLEKNPDDTESLSTLLREAHSLKGDSRSAGVNSVETLAHAIEDVLSGIQIQTISLDSTVSDQLYAGLDAIGQLVQEAVTGAPAEIDAEQLVQKIKDSVPSVPTVEEISQPPVLPVTVVPEPAPAAEPKRSSKSSVPTDTIRVQTRDLDALTAQAEELAVTRIQIAQTSTQAEQLMALWEEWRANKDKQLDASAPSYEERLESLLLDLRTTVQSNSTKLELVSEDLRNRVRRLQLLPLSTLFQPLQRAVRDLAKQQAKDINLLLEGEEATADKRLLDGIKDSLMHIVRNAVDHGIETSADRASIGKPSAATLRVKAYQTAISLMIEITDDGRGLDTEKIKQTALKRKLHTPDELEAMSASQIQRLILAPGFSTRSFITEISGRGVGLDVVRNQVERLKGSIQIESTLGQGTTFRLQLSTALSTANVVLVEIQGMTFAMPIEFLQTTLLLSPNQVTTVDGQDTIMVDDQSVPIANLGDVLELANSPIYNWVEKPTPPTDGNRPCVVLKVGNDQAGFLIDRLVSQQEVVSKPLSPLLKRVRNVTGTTILGTGDICMILNAPDLLKSVQRQTAAEVKVVPEPAARKKPVILLVEDSPPVRIQEKRLFEGAGYVVVTATNGLEGYNTLQTGIFDAVVSDVEMPHLDGFSLVAKIREDEKYDDLPIILVTTLDSDADRQRGAEAGANAYILKGRFNQEVLLETLARLL